MKVVELSPGEWDGLVQRSPQATLFHTNEWLTILEQTYKPQVFRLGFIDGERLLGGIPVLVRKKFIYRIAGSPSSGTATPYQGFICFDPADCGRLFQAFWSYTHTRAWDFVEVTPPPGMSHGMKMSSLANVRCQPRQTICLDLAQGEEWIFGAMEKDCRNQIRQAEKRGAVVEEVVASNSQWVEAYFDMSVRLYRRQHRPPAIPRSFFENLSRILGASGKLRVLFAKYQDQVVAAQIFLIHEGRLYYWDGVSKQAFSHLRANNLIQWHIIRWACSNGLRVYDMMGANIPRIAQFKKGFGGSFVPYSTYVNTRGLLARVGVLGYKWLAPTVRRAILLLARGQ